VFARVNGIEFVQDPEEPDGSAAAARSFSPVRLPALGKGPRVVINEVDLGSIDAVELYNAGDAGADLTAGRSRESHPVTRRECSGFPSSG